MKSSSEHDSTLLFAIAWLVMIGLTGISIWIAFLGLGLYAAIVQYGIAATQTAILFVLFMRLKGPPSLTWIFAGSGFFWLLFLYGLTWTDYATRRGGLPQY
jgi:cytochrome c oxidase subunit IV